MTYKILSTTQNDETLVVNVEYTFDDLTTSVIDVPIFAPDSLESVNTSLTNRGLSEQNKRVLTTQVSSIIPNIVIGEVITI